MTTKADENAKKTTLEEIFKGYKMTEFTAPAIDMSRPSGDFEIPSTSDQQPSKTPWLDRFWREFGNPITHRNLVRSYFDCLHLALEDYGELARDSNFVPRTFAVEKLSYDWESCQRLHWNLTVRGGMTWLTVENDDCEVIADERIEPGETPWLDLLFVLNPALKKVYDKALSVEDEWSLQVKHDLENGSFYYRYDLNIMSNCSSEQPEIVPVKHVRLMVHKYNVRNKLIGQAAFEEFFVKIGDDDAS